jgi:hypothetical protein
LIHFVVSSANQRGPDAIGLGQSIVDTIMLTRATDFTRSATLSTTVAPAVEMVPVANLSAKTIQVDTTT